MRFHRAMQLEPLETRRLFSLTVTPYDPMNPVSELTDALVTPQTGVNVVQATYVGQSGQAGTYSGLHLTSGQESLDLDDGVLLTSGLASNALGPNDSSAITQAWNTAGDPDMTQLVGSGYSTFDANILTIDFNVSAGTQSISFDLVFGSDEFPEYSGINDAFGAFLDGQQVSFDSNGQLVSVSNVFFTYDNTNQGAQGKTPVSFDVEYDGLTTALRTTAPLDPMATTHTLKLVIVDAGDTVVDSGVFLARLAGDTSAPRGPSTGQTPTTGASEFNFFSSGQTFPNNGQFVPVVIERTGDLSTSATVDFATADGTAMNGVDYDAASGTLTFDPNETSKTIYINVYENPGAPANSTFTLELTSPSSGATLGGVSVQTVTLTNSRSLVEFALSEIPAAADSGMVAIEVRRTGNLDNAVTVQYATEDDTAVAGVDYAPTQGTLNFGPGQATLFIVVPLPYNPNLTDGATFNVHLVQPAGLASLGELINAWVHLHNTYSLVQWSAAAAVADRATGQATLTIRRSGRADLPASVSYGTADADGMDGVDYTAASGVVAFAPGETARTVVIPLISDRTRPANVHFVVTLASAGQNTVVGPVNTTTVAVQNNGSIVQFVRRALSIHSDNGMANLVIQRTGNLDRAASVAYATQLGTAVAGLDYISTGGIVAFAPGEAMRTISIRLPGGADRPAKTVFTVVLALGGQGAVVGDARTASVTVINDHSVVQFTSATYAVAEAQGTLTLSLSRVGGVNEVAEVAYRVAGGTATAGVDYLGGNGVIEFASGQRTATIQLQVNTDADVEPAETIQLQLFNASDGVLFGANSTAVVSLTDTTAPPTIQPIVRTDSTSNGSKMQSLSLSFDQPLMSAPPLSAFTLVELTPGKPGTTWRGKPIALRDIQYDETTHAAMVVPVKALKANTLYQLTVADDRIQSLSGQFLGGSDSSGVYRFGHGRKLQYTDDDGDRVSLKLSGPGEMNFFSAGDATRLSIAGAAARTFLIGDVLPVRGGASDGRTTLTAIVGLPIDHRKLAASEFDVIDDV